MKKICSLVGMMWVMVAVQAQMQNAQSILNFKSADMLVLPQKQINDSLLQSEKKQKSTDTPLG